MFGPPTLRDWQTVFRVIMTDTTRTSVESADACDFVSVYRDFTVFFGALTAETENDAVCPYGLNSTFASITNHLLDIHGAELPDSKDVTDAELSALTRVLPCLFPVIPIEPSMN